MPAVPTSMNPSSECWWMSVKIVSRRLASASIAEVALPINVVDVREDRLQALGVRVDRRGRLAHQRGGDAAAVSGRLGHPRAADRKRTQAGSEAPQEMPVKLGLECAHGTLLGIPPWYAGVGETQPQAEEETSCDSTPNRTSFTVVSTCTPAACTSASWNQDGEVLLHRDMKAAPGPFLQAIAPYREDVVVCVECIFTWYWLADLCAHEGIPFVLGHALYMKAIHGGKAKNDRIDAHKIAVLLRGGMIPQAYVYPAGDARHPGPAPASDASHAPPGRPARPYPKYEQPVQPPADRQEARVSRRTGAAWRSGCPSLRSRKASKSTSR